MKEIEIIDTLLEANGVSKEGLGFTDYVELHKRMNRVIKYYFETKGEPEKEEEGGTEND